MYYVKTANSVWDIERQEYWCRVRPRPLFVSLSLALAYAAACATEDSPSLLIQSAQPFGYVWPDGTLLLARDADEMTRHALEGAR